MSATQPLPALRSRSFSEFGCKSAMACISLLSAALFFCAPAQAQNRSLAIATDQSSLGVSNQFGVPVNRAADAAGDYAFIGDGDTAVFYRKAGGSKIRLLQSGDALPVSGFAVSQVASFGGAIFMNSSGRIVFQVGISLADGLRHSAVMTYDGASATYSVIAFSDNQAADEPTGTIYGSLAIIGINNNGDVAFNSQLIPLGPLGQQNPSLTYYIAPGGGAPVRVAGVGDPVIGIAGSAIGSLNLIYSFNSSGQLLFEATVAVSGAGTKTSLLVASIAPGIQKVVSTSDTAPTGGTFTSVITTQAFASMNDSGQVVFWSTTSSGASGIWTWTLNTGVVTLTALQTGAPAPAPLSGNLSFPGSPNVLTIDDAGDVLVVAQTVAGVLRYHLSGGAIDVVAYTNETAPNLSGKTFSAVLAASMANDGTVAFPVGFNEGGHAIYYQTGTGAPALVASDSETAPVTGGGTLFLGSSSPKSLGAGLVFFNASISGGTAYYGEFFGTSSSVQSSLMSTADPLPSGARMALPAFSGGTTGGQIAFLAQNAGGLLSLYENNLGGGGGNSTEFSSASILLASEGEAAPGGLGPITFSFPLNPYGTPIFTNQVGQVLLPASIPQGQALFLASSMGLTKVAAVGDTSPIGGTYSVVGWNTAGPSPLNDSGQVAFAAALSSGGQGVFLYGPGGTVKIVVTGDTAPGIVGTFSSPSGGPGNPNLAVNSSGQVLVPSSFVGTGAPHGFFEGSGGPLTKVAASGDAAGGSTLTTVGSLSSFNNQGQIAFLGITAAGKDGIFTASAGSPIQTVALDGTTAPATGGGTYATTFTRSLAGVTFTTLLANVAINDEGDVVFRSGVTGGTTSSGFFRMLSSGANAGVVQAIALQGNNAPGGLGTFGPMGGANTPGFTFALGQHGELAFAGTVITSGGSPIGGDFEVATDNSRSKIALSGDVAPWSGGGTVTLQGLSFSANDNSFVYQLGASGGTANQAVMINLPPSGGDTSTTSLVSSLNPSIMGQDVLLTATVSDSIGFTPTTVVVLADNGTVIAVGELDANGQVSFNLSSLATGSHSLVAWYIGDNIFESSTSSPVTQLVTSAVSLKPTSTSLGSSANPVGSGQLVQFTATVTSAAGGTPTGSVGFLDGGNLIGTGTLNGSGQATFSTSSLAFGAHPITAEYYGDANYASSVTVAALNESVEPPTTSNTILTVAGGGSGGVGICSVNRLLGIYANDYYIFSCFQIFRITPDGTATLIAGNGMIGYAGDGGPATSAEFGGGFGGGVLDASGNLYLADSGNERIRVVNMQSSAITVQGVTIQPGDIATVAGNGTPGFLDASPATSGELNLPESIALNGSGTIFIADEDNNRIRMVSGGTISTIAGSATAGFGGDNGPAASATLNLPTSVALDSSGNLYIVDSGNNRVRAINLGSSLTSIQNVSIPAGDIATIAGNGTGGYVADGVAAISTSLTPSSVFVSGSNNVFITDSSDERVREVSAGIITTIAGNGIAGNDSNLPATSARILNPFTIYVAPSGDIFFDTVSGLQEVTGGFLQNPLGNPAFGFSGDSGPANMAQIFYPQGLAIDGSGNIVFADAGNYRIRKVTVTTGVIATLAGNGLTGSLGDNGLAANAVVEPSTGLAIDHSGNIFFGEKAFAGPNTNCRVREIVALTGVIKTVAGNGTCTYAGDTGLATSASITIPNGVAVDAAGNLYILEGNPSPRVRVVNMQASTTLTINGIAIAPGNIATIAGTGTVGYLGDGGLATTAEFRQPQGIALDRSGNIYIADSGNDRIRVINTQAAGIITVAGVTINPGDIQTVAGNGVGGYTGDGGQALSAELNANGLTVDSFGDIFFADGGLHVRGVMNSTGIILTFAGDTNRGFSGDGGPATSAELNSPINVALDSAGRLYISDEGNARIRVVGNLNPVPTATSLSPTSANAGSTSFTLTVNGADFQSGAVVNFNGKIENTTFVSATQLTAIITASDINAPQTVGVTVTNPVPSGGPSGEALFTINNLVPTLTSTTPGSAVAGGAGFTLTVNGTNFSGISVVSFNGKAEPTTFVSGTQVTAAISAGDIATAGIVNVSVNNPGAGASPNVPFSITTTLSGTSQSLRFVPVTPCRIADTRSAAGPFGGPSLGTQSSRSFPIPTSACGIPSNAAAYSLNVTALPWGPLGYITIWPTGQAQPFVSTLNSLDGRVKANAAIVPAGTSGAVSVFATDPTDIVLDINGYFVPATADPAGLAFYPLTPCRLVDTRQAAGQLAGPSLGGGQSRTFPLQSSDCNIPANAQAYSLNFTAVPWSTLGYLTVWPTGQAQPFVSTLNAPTGTLTANAAIVPVGTNGSINTYVTDNTDLIIDINGYFAPPAPGGLSLYTLPPCRVLDTRTIGQGNPLNGEMDVNVSGSSCSVPASAQAYVFNATALPDGALGYLTLWPQAAAQPLVSTLNALDGADTSNMAIVPTNNGSVSAYTAGPTQLILDISAFFAP